MEGKGGLETGERRGEEKVARKVGTTKHNIYLYGNVTVKLINLYNNF
jgi:hypothetical protein